MEMGKNNVKFRLLFSISNYSFLQEDETEAPDLRNHFTPTHPAQIYFILAKNRITIDKNYFDFNNDTIKLKFNIQNKENTLSEIISIPHPYPDLKGLRIDSEYPYTDF